MMKLVRGYTLIEIVVVMVIASGIFLWVISFSDVFLKNETAKRINNDTELILEAMNQYYHKHCNEAVFPSVSERSLRDDGMLIGGSFINPWGESYQLTIDRLQPRNPQLRVSSVFNDSIDADYVAGMVDHAKVSGAVVTWIKNSTLSRVRGGVMRQMDREAFGTPLC